MVLFRFQFCSLSQITVYIAIYIEWKYKNDTSFDNGINFHVNTMVLKCKCFLPGQLIKDHIKYSQMSIN